MLTQVKQADVDAVLALAYPGDSVLYAKQAKELGLKSPFQFIAIGPSDAFFPKAVGEASAEGVVTIAHWAPRPEWKGSQAFYDAYVKKFGEDPDFLNSALAWMSLEILQDVVAKHGLDKEKIRAGDQHRDLRNHQRQGEIRRSAERDHAHRLRAVSGRQAADHLAGEHRHRQVCSRRRPGSARAAARYPAVGQLLFAALVTGSVYALIALGLNLVYGTMRMLNVAHGDVVMLGAYAAFWALHAAGIVAAAGRAAGGGRRRPARLCAVSRHLPTPAGSRHPGDGGTAGR